MQLEEIDTFGRQRTARALQDRLAIVRAMSTQLHPAPARDRGTPGRARTPMASAQVARLVVRSASGDSRAWDELVDRFGALVWAIARAHRLSDADAEDVFQATWLRLLEHADRLTHPGRLAGWLATTARREAVRVARLNARMVPIDENRLVGAADGDDTVAIILTCERDTVVRRALATLPARDQTLLTLLTAEPHCPYEEISRTLDMPIGSIGPTRERCLGRLRRATLAAGLEPSAAGA